MKLRDAKELSDIPNCGVPQIDRSIVRILWASDYWDGPMSGMCSTQGADRWFSFAQESEDESAEQWCRRFWLLELTASQLEAERARHRLFRRFVGTHFDYDANGNRDAGAIRDQSEWTVFYDRFPPDEAEPEFLDDAEVVGWFQC